MGLTFEITGQKAIDRAFKKLGPKIGKKPIRKGARAGAKVMAAAVKSRAPVGQKRSQRSVGKKPLRSQVKVRSLKVRRGNILIGATTGQSGKANLNSGDGFYGQFMEYGRRPGGWHKQRLAPKPFIRPAFEASKDKANATAVKVIVAETNAELKRS